MVHHKGAVGKAIRLSNVRIAPSVTNTRPKKLRILACMKKFRQLSVINEDELLAGVEAVLMGKADY